MHKYTPQLLPQPPLRRQEGGPVPRAQGQEHGQRRGAPRTGWAGCTERTAGRAETAAPSVPAGLGSLRPAGSRAATDPEGGGSSGAGPVVA